MVPEGCLPLARAPTPPGGSSTARPGPLPSGPQRTGWGSAPHLLPPVGGPLAGKPVQTQEPSDSSHLTHTARRPHLLLGPRGSSPKRAPGPGVSGGTWGAGAGPDEACVVLFWKPRVPGLGAPETGREPRLSGAPSATQGHFPLWSLTVGLRMMRLWLPGAHRKRCGLAVTAARFPIRQGRGACPFSSVPPLQGGARPPPPSLGPFRVGGWDAVRRTFLGTPWRCGGSEASWRCRSAPGTHAPGVSRGSAGPGSPCCRGHCEEEPGGQ